MNSRALILGIAGLLVATSVAFAQVISYGPANSLSLPTQQAAGVIRVQVQLGGPLPAQPAAPGEEQRKQNEQARLQLYSLAQDECRNLSKSFDAECKLVSVVLNANTVLGSVPAVNATATALYDLQPRSR